MDMWTSISRRGDAPCTTDFISFSISRDDYDGYEHVVELQPVFVAPQTPRTGDRIALLTHPSVARCDPPEKVRGAAILSIATGAEVGRIQLLRALCRKTTNAGIQLVYAYCARSLSSVGVPPDMDYMSTFLRTKDTGGVTDWADSTIITVPNPANGALTSNVWVDIWAPEVVSVSACARYYPSYQSKKSEMTAMGCTEFFTLP